MGHDDMQFGIVFERSALPRGSENSTDFVILLEHKADGLFCRSRFQW